MRALALIISCATPLAVMAQSDLPAGTYTADPTHSSITFTISHLGLSNFTASFDTFTATLEIDPSNPGDAALSAEIDVASLDLPAPPAEFVETMMGPAFFNAPEHPVMNYQSTGIDLTDDTTATVTGVLTLLGTEHPVPLEVTFNTGFPPGVIEPWARLGFSATGRLNRSDFGMVFGVPEPGSTFGVGDEVTFAIEAEFIQSQ